MELLEYPMLPIWPSPSQTETIYLVDELIHISYKDAGKKFDAIQWISSETPAITLKLNVIHIKLSPRDNNTG
jgi:hypothetical protein